ncbi:hypothetical protein AMECASPLE_011980 [Ameca splendens]|uniref:Uncharacterized protein n=1 Tax=Ameca splendens TaxID=208324 RepID=A0ABV0XE19_9TELE
MSAVEAIQTVRQARTLFRKGPRLANHLNGFYCRHDKTPPSRFNLRGLKWSKDENSIWETHPLLQLHPMASLSVSVPTNQLQVCNNPQPMILQGSTFKVSHRWISQLQEISEEKACREALRKKITVPYFHPENLPIYQSLLQGPTPNTGSRSQDPALTTKPDSAETVVKHVPHKTPPPPSNPTASQPESQAEESERMPERRHANLTTQSAGESSLRSSCRQYKSVQVDVTGKPRRTKVRLPTCLLATKPCSVPNQHVKMNKKSTHFLCLLDRYYFLAFLFCSQGRSLRIVVITSPGF